MYRYDQFDRTLVAERVSEFRDQVARRLAGALTEEEFKPLRLMNGVYLQLHAYMLRIAIPYGTLSSEQLRMLAHVARRYDRNYGHFTTRQNIQFNWIKLAELPDAMADLASAGLHGIQTSGNCVRNITTDQWAGVAPDELEDPRIFAEILRQHLSLHPEFSFLPRKFKIAVTAAAHDRAAVKVHDIGLRLHRNGAGEVGFEVIVGGGLGRTPFIGKTIKPFLPKRDLLSYIEAILRVYNQYGRRDNIYKARIKILVHERGAEAFTREVEEEWLPIRDGALALDPAIVANIAARFSYPDYLALDDNPVEMTNARAADARFAAWVDNSVANHKASGYAIVTLSLGCARAAVVVAAAYLATSPSVADFKDNGPINYTVDGATAGGYFKVVTEAINGLIRETYPGSAATYKPGSPAGGILNISRGQSDFTFNGGPPEIGHALDGKPPFTESLKGKFTFVMLLHQALVVHNLMTREWAERHGIKSFADIAAKKPPMRLHVNQLANLQSTLSMYVSLFDAFGIKEAEVTKGGSIFRSNASGGMEALRDGKIDVFINGGFLPTAEVADIARGRPLLWISGEPDRIKAAAGRWANETLTVPKGVYPFVTQDEVTIVIWNAITAGAHVPEETVYKLIKAMAENRDRVRSIHPSLGQFALEQVARNPTELSYHPGAARYYREAGVLK